MLKKGILYILVLLLFFPACTVTKYIPVQGETQTVIEYKETIKDTVIYVPVIDTIVNTVIENITTDTTSVLENKFSKSIAEIDRGELRHTLMGKPNAKIKDTIYIKETIKTDSIANKEVITVEVEKPIRDNLFWYSIIANILFVVVILLKIFKVF
jgi:hypothetical protein